MAQTLPRRPIEIVAYNPAWPARFDAERAGIDAALTASGSAGAMVEHVGSTAVPGLAAKDVIDIMVGLPADTPLDGCVAPLQAIGWEYGPEHEAAMPDRRFFRKRLPNYPQPANLHVVHRGSDFWTEKLLFRDYLRAHPDVADAYAAHKRALAPSFTSQSTFANAKADFILATLAAARADPVPDSR